MVQRWIIKSSGWALRHPWWVLLGAMFVTLVAGWGAKELRLDADLTELLPSTYPEVQAVKALVKETGGLGYDVIAVSSPDARANGRFLQELERRLQGHKMVDFVIRKEPLDFFRQRALLFLSKEELEKLYAAIQAEIKYQQRKANPLVIDLDDPAPRPASPWKAMRERFRKGLAGLKDRYSIDNGRYQGILVRPKGFANHTQFNQLFVSEMEKIIATVGPTRYHPLMKIDFLGPFVGAHRETTGIDQDIGRAGQIAGGLLLFLLLFFFRRVSLVLMLLLSLLMGIIWTLGLTYAVFGTLNLITGFIGAVLLGLGIDYGIHILSRYLRERALERSPEESLVLACGQTGYAAWTGCLTTAATFATLMVSDFRGFSQFGAIAAGGVLCCLLAMLLVLPAFLALCERHTQWLQPQRLARWRPTTYSGAFPWARTLAFGALGITGLCLWLASGVQFELDQNKLGYIPYDDVDNIAREQRLQRLLARGKEDISPLAFLVRSAQEARALTKLLKAKADKSKRYDLLSQIVSVHSLVPLAQEARLHQLGKIRKLLARHDLASWLEGEPLRSFRQFQKLLDVKAFKVSDLPRRLRQDLLTPQGGYLVYVNSRAEMHNGHLALIMHKLLADIELNGKQQTAAGGAMIFAVLLTLVTRDGLIAIGLSLLAVLLMLLLRFRAWRPWLLSMCPLIAGLVLMLGAMAAFGIKLTFMNIVALPVLVGIGIDDGVHLLHEYQEAPELGVMTAWRKVFWPMVLSTCTSVMGFLGMVFCHHQGLRGIGILASIGLCTCLFASFVMLPALMQLILAKEADADKTRK